MLGDSAEVRGILTALAGKMKDCSQCLNAQGVGNALYGLQSLKLSMEARVILRALVPYVEGCAEHLSPQHVGNALYGLQGLGASEEAHVIVKVLTPKISQCAEVFQGQNIGNALYGLQSFQDSPEVKELLKVMITKTADAAAFTAQEISNAFFGLKNLDDSSHVRELVATLTPKLKNCQHPLKVQHVFSILQTLRCLGDSVELRGVLALLKDKVAESRDSASWQSVERVLDQMQDTCINEVIALKAAVSRAQSSATCKAVE
jgi:hypothetical protein